MHCYYRQLTPPTCVEHALRANFTGESTNNLIISKSNVLEVYSIVEVNDSPKLVLINSFDLFGNIESMGIIRFPGNKRDTLILTFTEAKVSFVDFDLKTNDLKTKALFYLEDDFLKEGCLVFSSKPIIKVDKRCCAILLYDYKLAIIPFVQQELGQEKSMSEIPVMKHIVIDLKELGLSFIKDYCFLAGYYEPTLLILHDTEKTSSSRIYLRKNTSVVTAISLDLQRKHYPVIWTVKQLPSTCYKLIPVQEPIGGALVVGFESMIHVNQKATCGISLNDFSKMEEMHCPIALNPIPEYLVMTGVGIPVARDRILFSVGETVWVVRLEHDTNYSVKKMIFQNVASFTNEASCLVILDSHLMFFGSRLNDSHLVTFQEKRPVENEDEKRKKQKIDEDDYLAQLEAEEKGVIDVSQEVKYDFKIVDSIGNIGPISCFSISETPGNKEKLEIVACSGFNNYGGISIMRKSIRPVIKTQSPYGAKVHALVNKNNFLFIGLDRTSKIWKVTEKEVGEVDQRDDTIMSIYDAGKRVVQVFHTRIRLLESSTSSKFEETKTDRIMKSSMDGNHLLLQMADESIRIYHMSNKITQLNPQLSKGYGKQSACFIYQGVVSIFWSSGCLELYRIEKDEFVPFFVSFLAGSFLSILLDDAPSQDDIDEFSNRIHAESIQVRQMVIQKFDTDVYMILLLSNSRIVVYRRFMFESNVRFTKISTDFIPTKDDSSSMIQFENIGGKSGIFLTGASPAFILSSKSHVYIHPMDSKSAVTAFTSFNNSNCVDGFVYATAENNLCFATLDETAQFQGSWNLKRVPLNATPTSIAYHPTKPSYLVSTFKDVPLIYQETKLIGRFPDPTEAQYTLRLLNPRNFAEMDSFALDPHEHVSHVKLCHIAPKDDNEENRNRDYVPMFVVASSFVQHEEVGARGRLYLFELDTKNRNRLALNMLTRKELRGPCSAMCELDGFVATCAGPKIYVCYYDWENNQFIYAAFFDAQFYLTSMVSIKRFLCFGDRFESLQFLNWKKNQGNALDFLGRDYSRLQVSSLGFLVQGDTLGMVVADEHQNLQVFGFKPKGKDKSLIAWADFNVGGVIKEFQRLQAPDDKTLHMNLFSTTDGSIGCLVPIPENIHRRFNALQTKLYTYMNHAAGLHPKAFRLFKPETHSLHNPKKNVIDGEIVFKMLSLNSISQRDLAKQIGYKSEDLESHIVDMEKTGSYF